jgi:hypothetical protein
MIDREHDLSLTRQAEALAISRGSVYYQPQRWSQKIGQHYKWISGLI